MSVTTLGNKFVKLSTTAALQVWKGFQTMASDSKHPRLIKKIGTHSGVFHCDEALACFMLKQLPEYRDAQIIRTRDSNVLDTCDIVVDVGGVYDVQTNRFDHHQKGFNHTLSTERPDLIANKNIKLSSAGLVYAHFGTEVLMAILSKETGFDCASKECLKAIYLHIYEVFVEELDAIDNGIPMHSEGQPRYRIGTHLSARVHRLNPVWNSEDQATDGLFQKAMELVGTEFVERIVEAGTVWWPARDIVQNAINERKDVHESGYIIELKQRCPWKEHFFALEEAMGIVGEIKFVIFYDRTDQWRVQSVPLQPDSFICRIFLHKDWRGVRDEQLSEISGIPDCVFCHSTGFIGGHKSRKGAIEMAVGSLKAEGVLNVT